MKKNNTNEARKTAVPAGQSAASCYTVLDLFSGIGGFSLGLERTGGFRTVAFCEISEFCRKVLRKHWPDVPIHKDIKELNESDIAETVDVVCGGYPCQSQSLAGKRRGQADDRWLWPEMFRLIRELSPSFVIGENVTGHVSLGLDQVLSDLESEGYTARPFIIPACGTNAFHERQRVWVVAYSNGQRLQKRNEQRKVGRKDETFSWCEPARRDHEAYWNKREVAPRVYGRTDAVPHRVDRVRAIGNSIDPLISENIGRAILFV